MSERIRMSELQRRLDDPNTDLDELAAYLKPDPARSQPFKPAFAVNEQTVEVDRAKLVGLDLESLNAKVSRRRLQAYERRIQETPDQLRLLAEGDSWFLFPLFLKDVLANLMPFYAIYDVSAAGDTLVTMTEGLDRLEELIAQQKPHGFLISGGGNDIAGPEFKDYVWGGPPGASRPEDFISVRFSSFLRLMEAKYNTLFSRLTRRFPHLEIFCHGYDWAVPRNLNRVGIWLWPWLEERQVPEEMRAKVVAVMIDRFNAMLQHQARLFDSRVIHIDCRGTVGPNGWWDELHPDNAAFADIARKFKAKIDSKLAAVA